MHLYILRVAIWKTSQETVYGKGKRDHFWQQVSGYCSPEPFQWMSHWAWKRSTLIMKLYWFMTVPEIPCTILTAVWSPHAWEQPSLTSPSWATAAPSQARISLAALWPCAYALCASGVRFSQGEGRIYLHKAQGMWKGRSKKVMCFGLRPWCEAGA